MKKVIENDRRKEPFSTEKLTALGYNIEEITIYIDTVKNYDLLFISDLHILQLNEEVSQTDIDTVKSRIEIIRTTKIKLVPQRGWKRVIARTFSTVSGNFAS